MALVEIDVNVTRIGAHGALYAVDGADVTVQNADGSARAVYADEAGNVVIPQPIKSRNGRIDGWVDWGVKLRYLAVKPGELEDNPPWQYFVSSGPPGPAGPTGAQGPAGTPGEKWFTGAGAPAGTLGVVGDWYLNSSNADYYEKTDTSAWTLRGNLSAPAPEGWHVVGAAGEPAFENGWAAGAVAPAFYKDPAGIVRLRGDATGTTINTTIFTLPVGYRPAETILPFATDAGNAYAVAQITNGGIVRARAGSLSNFTLNNVQFRAA